MIPQYLKEDVVSFNRKKIYGRQGERVFIIKNLNHVVLVFNEYGERFSCLVENLTSKPINNATRNAKNKR